MGGAWDAGIPCRPDSPRHLLRGVALIKRSTNLLPPVYWWNDTIATLRKECIRARRLSQRGRKKTNSDELEAKYKEARRKLNKAIKSSKKQCWDELLDEVETDTWGRPYKVVMTRLKSQSMPSPTCPELLKKIITALFPQQPELNHSIEQYEAETIPPVTEVQLLEACGRVGNTKAPGLDGIPNIALKAAINAAPGLFLDVYNTCLQEGTFPAKWKQQRLVLLPKGKKPPDEPSSYRSLCMLDTAGKILERIVHRRIEAAVENHLADNQYGFRRGRSTLDAIDLVVNTVRETISGTRWRRGTKKYCLVATLDIKNAFNSAKWDCIMEALTGRSVPGYLRRMIVSYFTDRVLKYDTESGPKEYRVTGGVFQGFVLGPLLWNIMYDGLLKLVLPSEARLVAFADDVAVVIVAKHLEDINFVFDETFAKIRRWMESVGLKLAEHKTEAVLIISKKQVETITLRVGDYELTSQSFIRYLGVMIDTRLSFKQQAEHVSTKASAVRTVLSRLMPNVEGPKQRKASVLTYGIAIWADALQTQESRRKVAPVYRLSDLRVTSAYRTMSEDADVCHRRDAAYRSTSRRTKIPLPAKRVNHTERSRAENRGETEQLTPMAAA
ncbi:reverse transcriptase, partial [Lasius niger]